MTTQQSLHATHNAFFTGHPSEAARVLDTFAIADCVNILSIASGRNAAALLSRMTPSVAADVLSVMPSDLLNRAVSELPIGITVGLLHILNHDQHSQLLDRLPRQVASEITEFLMYPPDSAGSVMDPRVFAVPQDRRIDETIDLFRANAQKDIAQVHVIDRTHTLVGIVTLSDLLTNEPHLRLQDVMQRNIQAVHPMDHQERIVELFSDWKLPGIPVIDLDGKLLGTIRNQAIMEASREEATADMQTMVGVSKDERALSPVGFCVRKRLPWLGINVVTAFLAAFVVGLFESTIAKFTALAVLMPIVAGQSGNTGAQALAVVIRGLALRDIRPTQWVSLAGKEVALGMINGVAVAATVSAVVYLWSWSYGLSMVIGIAMVLSMTMACLAGAMIPIALNALHHDPAQSSSIILTTVTDVVGFLSFLGLATIFAPMLA